MIYHSTRNFILIKKKYKLMGKKKSSKVKHVLRTYFKSRNVKIVYVNTRGYQGVWLRLMEAL